MPKGQLLLFPGDSRHNGSICLEVGLQNGTLALLITTSILHSAQMSIAPSVYSLLMFAGASFFTWWVVKRKQA